MCFAGGHRNDRTSTIPIDFCLFGFITGSPSSLARLRLSGRRRSFAGTALGFERIGAGVRATMLADRRSRLMLAGTDFFTAEVLTLRGLVTYYVLFFIHLESRKVDIAGITVHPNEQWMQQMARNATMEECGALRDCRFLLHDRDTKYTRSFRAIIVSGQVKPLALPAHSPNLNAYAERWVRSVKEECLSKMILFGERALRRALNEYVSHYHAERNHQGKGNVRIVQSATRSIPRLMS